MGLEHMGKLDLVVKDTNNTNDTRVITNGSNSTLVQVCLLDQVNTVGLATVLSLGDALLLEIVPELDVTVLTNSHTEVAAVTNS